MYSMTDRRCRWREAPVVVEDLAAAAQTPQVVETKTMEETVNRQMISRFGKKNCKRVKTRWQRSSARGATRLPLDTLPKLNFGLSRPTGLDQE
jgi:hypothetical protein